MSLPRIAIGYHGCLQSRADELLNGRLAISAWPASTNRWDWLGRGIYFWENAPARASAWAEDKARRNGRDARPAVVGAFIGLDGCFDLTDTANTQILGDAFDGLRAAYAAGNQSLPTNGGNDSDLKRRELDCLVINYCLDIFSSGYDSVRAVFEEGPPSFSGSQIRRESHVQIAVRNPSCILGIFRPNL